MGCLDRTAVSTARFTPSHPAIQPGPLTHSEQAAADAGKDGTAKGYEQHLEGLQTGAPNNTSQHMSTVSSTMAGSSYHGLHAAACTEATTPDRGPTLSVVILNSCGEGSMDA